MDVIRELLRDVPLPRLVKVRQTFPATRLTDVPSALRQELARDEISRRVKPGMRVAVAVGSRGVAEIPTLARVTVEELKRLGAEPFVVPAMGSHGGATAEGQRDVLANLGVTEASVGCPILASMEVVEIGRLDNGLPVYIDKYAYNADGIVVINRVKPHTAFRGANESGMVKMITIGLGKQRGAESAHAFSFKYMAEHIVAMAKVTLANMPVLFGVGTVENAYDQVAKVVAVTPEALVETDRKLLVEARANMPSLPFAQIDVLIVDRIGKDISGDGMDPNITGRYPTPYASGGPDIAKLAVLDLTGATHGNANGMGKADVVTRRLVDKTNFPMTYCNALTSTVFQPVMMPMVMESDRDAVAAAVKTCNARDLTKARVVRIKDTLHLEDIRVSEALLAEAGANPRLTVTGEPVAMRFDGEGNLAE
ncbi:MAG TPA: lactate racemase domain-containing protein [Negativicutes bacterium]|nr:lactate racemase domain-containing protein [Negativicutes bacterium]